MCKSAHAPFKMARFCDLNFNFVFRPSDRAALTHNFTELAPPMKKLIFFPDFFPHFFISLMKRAKKKKKKKNVKIV